MVKRGLFFGMLFVLFFSGLLWAQSDDLELLTRLQAWRDAQVNGDLKKLQAFYSPAFRSGPLDLKAFLAKREQELKGKHLWIGLENFKLIKSSDQQAVVSIREYILSGGEITHQELTLDFVRQDDKWLIVKEVVTNRDVGYKYCVQLIPFALKSKAQRFYHDLKQAGFDCYIYEDEIEGQKVYILRLGDFKKLDHAEQFLNMFAKKTVLQSYISKVDSLQPLQVSKENMSGAEGEGQRGRTKTITEQSVGSAVLSGSKGSVSGPARAKEGSTGYGLHIASYRSRAKALANWNKLKKNYPNIFKSLNYYLKKVNLGNKGIYYRLLAGQMSKSKAYNLLKQLKKIIPDCRVVRLKSITKGEWDVEDDLQISDQGHEDRSVSGPILGTRAVQGPTLTSPKDTGPSLGPTLSPGQAGTAPTLGGSLTEQPPVATGSVAPVSSSLARDVQQLKEQVARLRREAEARKKLQATEAEQKKKEEQILEAAGRQYTLLKAGTIGLEYNLSYSYYSYDAIEESVTIEHHANHNLRNILVAEYALLDNLTLNANVPFVYKFDKVGTSTSNDVTDLGDISLGVKYQPIKSGGDWPAPILSLSLSTPTGRGAYEINPDTELSTGSSLYSLSSSLSLSKGFDPVSGFASVSYTHGFSRDGLNQRRGSAVLKEVVPGDSVGLSVGLGYALSYKVSLSLSYSYSYALETDYHWGDGSTSHSGTAISSSLSVSTGWHLTPTQSVVVGLGVGLTDSDADFSFSFRYPFQFSLK